MAGYGILPFLMFFIIASLGTAKVSGYCVSSFANISKEVTVLETDPAGTPVTTLKSYDGEVYEFSVEITNTSNMMTNRLLQNQYLEFDIVNDTYSLVLKKELDLELLELLLMGVVTEFQVHISCTPFAEEDRSTETTITVTIQPVNEFAPVFFYSPYSVKVPEDTEVGTVVFDLSKRVKDADVTSESTLTYRLLQHNIREFDGSKVFGIGNPAKGDIILKKPVDFEELKDTRMVFYMLNVSVMDSGGLQATATVNMTITDSDDQGPVFVYPGCANPCEELTLEISTHENYTGPLPLGPAPLLAHDRDTMNNTVLFSFIADAENLTEYFSIDENTADLYQVKPLTDTNVTIIELQIEAAEKSLKRHSIIAYLTIIIVERVVYDDFADHVVDYENFHGKNERIEMNKDQDYGDFNDTIARNFYNKVRVLCWIMTGPKNLETKATAVKLTWAKRCNKFIFFSSVTNKTFPTIGLNVSEGRQHLTAKTVQAFLYCYVHYGKHFDWFLKADDDTYVIAENLRYFLSFQNPSEPIYFGFKFRTHVKQGYFSGGAGYVLSKKALQKFASVGLRNPFICRQDGGAEDAEVGKCMAKLEIKAGDSLDVHGRETFHPFKPISHLEGSHPQWFKNYSFHPIQKGLGCCSQYTISFHYVSPSDMYLLDFLLYHIRPHGLHSSEKVHAAFKHHRNLSDLKKAR